MATETLYTGTRGANSRGGAMKLMILVFFFFAGAEPLQIHKQQMQTFGQKMMEFEVRLNELKEKKEQTPEGEHLEEILSEITDIHKELLNIKKKREDVRQHIRKEHPKEETFADLSFYKQTTVKSKKDKKPDVQLDRKLDELLRLVQSQYVRTLSEDFKVSKEIQTEEDVRKKLKEQRLKVKKADKKKYIREEVESAVKVE